MQFGSNIWLYEQNLQINASITQRHTALSIIHYTEEIQTITSGAHSKPNGFGFGCGCILFCMIIHCTSVHFCRPNYMAV
jgi:hypothetical protein